MNWLTEHHLAITKWVSDQNLNTYKYDIVYLGTQNMYMYAYNSLTYYDSLEWDYPLEEVELQIPFTALEQSAQEHINVQNLWCL